MSAEVQPGHVTVPLRSRRLERVQFAQKIQHAVPAFGLVRGVRGVRAKAHHHGVDWIDICIAGVLFTEAAEKWRVQLHAAWCDVTHIHTSEHEAVIQTHKGRSRRLDFKDLENAADVRAVLEQAQERLEQQ